MTAWERSQVAEAIRRLQCGKADGARERLVTLLWNDVVYQRLLRNPRTERAVRLRREASR